MSKFSSTDSGATVLSKLNNTIVTVGMETGADYVCDGTADNVQIQAAIDEVTASGGGIVHIRPGTYDIIVDLIMKDNVVLEGEGWTTILKANTGISYATIVNEVYTLDAVTADEFNYNITIRDLCIDGNNTIVPLDQNFGIRCTNIKGVLIDNLFVKNTKGYGAIYLGRNEYLGVYTEMEAHWRINNCLVENHGGISTAAIWTIGLNRRTYDIKITNNTVRNCAYGSSLVAAGAGIMASKGACDVIISGNIIYHNGFVGINVDSLRDTNPNYVPTTLTDNIQISNNIIYDLAGALNTKCQGISVRYTYNDVIVSNNQIRDVNAAGIFMGGNVTGNKGIISGNKIKNCGKDTTVAAIGNRSGINLENGIDVRVVNNQVSDDQDTKTTEYGLVESGTANNNRIYDNDFSEYNTGAALIIGATTKIARNLGYITENSGTGTIANGATTATITHGLSVTPTLDDISITLGENPTNTPGAIWVSALGATTFVVNCENDPGSSGMDFSWRAVVL